MVFEPRPLCLFPRSAHQGRGSTPDCCIQEHWTSSPHSTQSEGFFPRRNRTSAFLILSLVTVAKGKFPMSAVKKWGLSVPLRSLPWNEGSTFDMEWWEYWGPDCLWLSSWGSGATSGEASQEDLRLLPPTYWFFSFWRKGIFPGEIVIVIHHPQLQNPGENTGCKTDSS